MPNPYPDRFLSLRLDAKAEALKRPTNNRAVIVDIGAGGRQRIDDDISLEYLWTSNNSLCGDVLALPFRDNYVDLILSQAVLEHVTDPDLAVREMRRVLRPGGVLYVEIAFMQPLHMDPHHYFNVTPRGLTWLLRDWDISEQGTLGSFEDMVEWLYREAGVKRSSSQKVQDRRARPPAILYERVAYGVYALARKPVV